MSPRIHASSSPTRPTTTVDLRQPPSAGANGDLAVTTHVTTPFAPGQRMLSLVHHDGEADVPRFLSQDTCRALIAQVQALGFTGAFGLSSQWRGDVRWARNRVTTARDWRTNDIGFGDYGENQLDPASLRAMVLLIQHDRHDYPERQDFEPRPFVWALGSLEYSHPHIWSEATYTQTPDARSTIANQLIDGAERAGMLSAGYLAVEARGTALHTEDGRYLYAPQTLAQCSLTVRDPEGTGSGWAGCSSYDWTRFDAQKLAEIALDKCLRSRHPVKIEPGRYTLIMEPQATFDFASVILRGGVPRFMDRANTEAGGLVMPFRASGSEVYPIGTWEGQVQWHRTRIGERVLDERITITFDPRDPDLGVVPFSYYRLGGGLIEGTDPGDPIEPVTWIDHGVLTNLSYGRRYALETLHEATGKPNTGAFRMSGGDTSIEEMIATTKRGLLVTRFWGLDEVDQQSMLCTGLTRDGLWLIEDGKISHPVMNLRFTESPLVAFNQVEQLGVPVPVFSPEIPAVVPPVKVRDFSFTAVVDAV